MPRIVQEFEGLQRDALAVGAFGLGLLGYAFAAVGMGHGSTTLVGLASAPLGLFGFNWLTTLGIPVLWYAIGLLLGLCRKHGRAAPLVIALLLHYVGIPLVFLTTDEFDDWATLFRKTPKIGVTACAYYALGQVAIWYRSGLLSRKLAS